MLRNGYLMPRYKSSLCCVKWMMKVKDGRYWCPLTKDIHPIQCADPPKKDLILEHLYKFAADKGHKLGITEKRVPDRDWALQVLFAIKPDLVFFKKDYVPKKAIDKILVNNSDGFFDGLPLA